MMRKILFLFLSLLLFGGCSFQSDELPSPSPDSNLISSSPPTLIPEQEEHAFSDYPKTKRFLYVCHNWKEKDIDPRLDLPEGESDFLRDSLVFVLYPQKNGTAQLHVTSRWETEYDEWIVMVNISPWGIMLIPLPYNMPDVQSTDSMVVLLNPSLQKEIYFQVILLLKKTHSTI